MSSSSSGRRRATDRHYSAEDQALDQISKEAEERIQARRQARAEAREIRMKEIERQQKEEEDKQKRQEGIPETPKSISALSSYSNSRRGSNDSTDTDASSKDSRDPKDQVRDLKRQLRELEDKYKHAMLTNAQLDNIKTSHVFQIELLKEQLEEQEESLTETNRQYKDKCRDLEMLKRDFEGLKMDLDGVKQFMEIKDKLLQESGLVMVSSEEGQLTLTKCSEKSSIPAPTLGSTIITEEAADLLKKAGEGTLGKASVKPTCNNEEFSARLDNKMKNTDDKLNADSSNAVSKDVSKVETGQVSDDEIDKKEMNNNDDLVYTTKNAVLKGNTSEIENEMRDLDMKQTDMKDFVNEKNDVSLGLCDDNVDSSKKLENVSVKVEFVESEDDEEDEHEDDVFFDSQSELISPVGHAQIDLMKEKMLDSLSANGSYLFNDRCISIESDKTYHRDSDDEMNQLEISEFVASYMAENNENKNNSSASQVSAESDDFFKDHASINVDTISENVTVDINTDDVKVDDENVTVDMNTENIKVDAEKVTVNIKNENINQNDITDNVKEDDITANIVDVNKDKEEALMSTESSKEIGDELLHVDSSVSDAAFISASESVGDIDVQAGMKVNSDYVPSADRELNKPVIKGEFDEVFNSVPEPVPDFGAQVDNDEDKKLFAKEYVLGIVEKSMEKAKDDLDESMLLKRMSLTSENIDIRILKRHYSEDLVEKISPCITNNLSRGSVEILSAITSLKTAEEGDDDDDDAVRFVSYKLDTDADLVVTSLPVTDNGKSSLKSPVISGFGICYVGNDADAEPDGADTLLSEGGIDQNFNINPEFFSLPIDTNSIEPNSAENGKSISSHTLDGESSEQHNSEMHTIVEDESETVNGANRNSEVKEAEELLNAQVKNEVEKGIQDFENDDSDVGKVENKKEDNVADPYSVGFEDQIVPDVTDLEETDNPATNKQIETTDLDEFEKPSTSSGTGKKIIETTDLDEYSDDDLVQTEDNKQKEDSKAVTTEGATADVSREEPESLSELSSIKNKGRSASTSKEEVDGANKDVEYGSMDRKKSKRKDSKKRSKDDKKNSKDEKRHSKEDCCVS